MKQRLTYYIVLCLITVISSSGLAENTKINGLLDIQYRTGDSYSSSGSDKFDVSALYLIFDKYMNRNVSCRVIVDGADLAAEKTTASHKYIEEAQVIFSDICRIPLQVVFGKDEMPFGQDYDTSLFDPLVHSLEIDKVWGINAGYRINDSICLEAGLWEQDASSDISISDNYSFRLSLDLFGNISSKFSFADIEQAGAQDETRIGAGLIYRAGNTVIYGEYIGLDNPGAAIQLEGYSLENSPALINLGAEQKICGNLTVKARYELLDDDSASDTFTGLLQTGIAVKIADAASLMFEYQKRYGEGGSSDADDFSAGVIAAF